jgi:hypothetical protein
MVFLKQGWTLCPSPFVTFYTRIRLLQKVFIIVALPGTAPCEEDMMTSSGTAVLSIVTPHFQADTQSLPRCYFVDILTPDHTPRRVPLPHVELIVGRNPQRCNVALEDAKVSRVHLRVAQELERVTVTDLYSANGTTLGDGMLVPGLPAIWLPDQTVTLGLTRLTLRYDLLNVGW